VFSTFQPRFDVQWIPTDTTPTSRPGSAMGTLSRLENPNQFAPQGINPAELKEKVKAVMVCF